MLDIGWSELLVIAVVAIIVVGPRDLPRMLRNLGRTMSQVRKMANEFQSQFNDALKEAELDDVRKDIESVRTAASKVSPAGMAKSFNPVKSAVDSVKKDVENAAGSADKPADKSAKKPDGKTVDGPAGESGSKPADPQPANPTIGKVAPAKATPAETAVSAPEPVKPETETAAKPDASAGSEPAKQAAS